MLAKATEIVFVVIFDHETRMSEEFSINFSALKIPIFFGLIKLSR